MKTSTWALSKLENAGSKMIDEKDGNILTTLDKVSDAKFRDAPCDSAHQRFIWFVI